MTYISAMITRHAVDLVGSVGSSGDNDSGSVVNSGDRSDSGDYASVVDSGTAA